MLKYYLIYIAKHFPIWVLVALLSITVIYFIVVSTYPPQPVRKVVVEGASQVVKVAREISTPQHTSTSKPCGGEEGGRDTFYAVYLVFMNNLRVNLLLSLPLVGPIFYGYALTYNAWVIRYLGLSFMGSRQYIDFLYMLLTKPHTYLEILAYSIAATESLFLGLKLVRRNVFKKDLICYFLSLTLSNTILYIAAIVEITSIT